MRPEKLQKENGNGNGSAGLTSTRCAIYTRKSTDEGLEQSFNTLDAQREASEAFINSQRHEGWLPLQQKYDDGGYTGANMDRPALKRLLADIESGASTRGSHGATHGIAVVRIAPPPNIGRAS